MKKKFTLIFLIFCGVLFYSSATQAQSLQEDIIGKWMLDDMRFILPENASEEEKEQYEMMQGFIAIAMEEMRGSVTIHFSYDGSYVATSINENDEVEEEEGTWELQGNQLYMSNSEEAVNIEIDANELRFVIEEDGTTMYMVFIPF